MILSTTISAFCLTSSALIPPTGCGTVTMGRSGIPEDCAALTPNVKNSSVQMVATGIPFFSNSTESWILHEVQEPQSPYAFTTVWHRVAISSMKSAGIEEYDLAQ